MHVSHFPRRSKVAIIIIIIFIMFEIHSDITIYIQYYCWMEIIYDVIYRSAQFTNFEDTMSIDTKMYLVNKVCFNVIIIIFHVLQSKIIGWPGPKLDNCVSIKKTIVIFI